MSLAMARAARRTAEHEWAWAASVQRGEARPAAAFPCSAQPEPPRPDLERALPVVLDALAAAPQRDKLRTALMAVLDDDVPAYRQRLAELLQLPAPGPAAQPRASDCDARGLDAPDRAVIEAALASLGRHLRTAGPVFNSTAAAQEYMRLHLAGWDRERFAVLFLDAQHRLIEFEVLFEGTLSQTSVHPREVVRRALQLNAAAVILAHNHPSGCAEPSRADALLTAAVRAALGTVDVQVLDHLVIGWPDVVSMAERGLM